MAKITTGTTDGDIKITPNGTGKTVVGTGAASATVQSSGNHNLVLQTGNATTGSITITDGADGNIAITPNGTGNVTLGGNLVIPDSGTIGSASAASALTIPTSGIPDFPNGLTLAGNTTGGNITGVTLDDYEEGSISGTAFKVNGTSITNINTGNSKYIKVGNLVNVSVYFSDSDVTLPSTGEFTMDLPFTAVNERISISPVMMYITAGTWDSGVIYPTDMVVSLLTSSKLAFFVGQNLNTRLDVTATGTGAMLLLFSITYPSI